MKKYKIKTLKKKTKEEELVKQKLLQQICLKTKVHITNMTESKLDDRL